MADSSRRVEDCEYRVSLESGDAMAARCNLLAEITGVGDRSLCEVRHDACLACCRSFPPTAGELNPIVASLLYGLASRIEGQGGVDGCDCGKAEALSRFALEYTSSEEECLGAFEGRGASASETTLEQIIPAPAKRTGSIVKRWAVGVTTAPRLASTLGECLASLANAGWENPRLFADGVVEVPPGFAGLARTDRSPQLGAWPSYYLALTELLLREPHADAYLIAQDDALFAADLGVRGYLERVLWPGKTPWVVSLFCPRPYTQAQPGWYPFRGVWVWGAQAFVFSREAAQCFLADLEVVRHRWTRQRSPLADIDWLIGQWAARRRRAIYFPTPSLVQHIGEVSSLWQGVRVRGYRRASWFARRG
jgi:hypothetical protein